MKTVVDICQHSALAGGGKTYADGLVRLSKFSSSEHQCHSMSFLLDSEQSKEYRLENISQTVFEHSSLHPSGGLEILDRLMFDEGLTEKSKQYLRLAEQFDLIHMTGDRSSPLIKNIPLVVTAFGGNHWIRPGSLSFQSKARRLLTRGIMKRSLKYASAILVPSVFMKDILVHFVGVSPEKIFLNELVWWASDILTISASKPVCAFSIASKKPFVLYSAAGYDYKNHAYVFEALKVLKEKYGLDVSIGLTGKLSPYLKNVIDQYQGDIDIMKFGYVSREELKWLYQHACAYVHPSLYEAGGSFSMFEAAYCNCPVLSSRLGSMLELGCEFSRTFDPYDPRSLSQELKLLVDNEDVLSQIQETSKKFIETFTPEKALTQIFDAYSFAVENGSEKC